MKNLLFAILSIGLVAMSCNQSPKGDAAETSDAVEVTEKSAGTAHSIDTEASTIKWHGAKVGKDHYGTLALSEGSLDVDGDKITGGTFVIDMSSITNTDMEGEGKMKLEGHLKSADFFNVDSFPTAKFELSKTTALTGEEGANTLVYGNLTIKGITKQVSFKANVMMSEGGITVTTPDFTIDRSEFNVRYGSDKFFDNLADKAINNDVGLNIELKTAVMES